MKDSKSFDKYVNKSGSILNQLKQAEAVKLPKKTKATVYLRQDFYMEGRPELILSEDDRRKVIEDGRLVKDTREDSAVSKVYDLTTSIKLTNPTETGIYEVLVRPNKFEKCLVIRAPYCKHGRANFLTVISLDKGNRWLNIHPSRLFVRSQYSQEMWNKWYDSLSDAETLPVSDSYDGSPVVLLSRSGQGTCPITADDDYSQDGDQKVYRVHWHDYCDQDKPYLMKDTRKTWAPFIDGLEENNGCRMKNVRLSNRVGAKFRTGVEELMVPAGFKKLNLKDDSDSSGETGPMQPGNLADIHMALVQNLTPLRMMSDGSDQLTVNDRKMDKESAFRHLVVDWDLREETADLLIKKAEEKVRYKVEFYVKLAAATQVDEGPSAPGHPDPQMSGDSIMGSGIPTTMNDERSLLVNDMMPNPGAREQYKPKGPDPSTMQIAQQASQTGQREIFDTAALGSLLKAVRQDNMIDRYQGDLMKGMDRLGRIYFQFLWHGEEFEDRYGKQDLPELEDGLRNAFEAAGDIILVLKRKSVEPFAEQGTDVDLGSVANG